MTPAQSMPAIPSKPRGVYELTYRGPGDETILVAIDRHGHRAGETLVPPRGDVNAAWAALQALLDQLDPLAPPPLRLLS